MPSLIRLTIIKALIQLYFDLQRSVDLHQHSFKHTKERAIAGRLSGLCELNDGIIWEATHLGFRKKLSVRISQMEAPFLFQDRMTGGAFKRINHQHHFEEREGITYMKDVFYYEVPMGILGKLFDRVYLNFYMARLLNLQNEAIKA